MITRDNTGQPIPKLYLIDLEVSCMDEELVKRVIETDWYIVSIDDDDGKYLMANASQLEAIGGLDFGDYVIYPDGTVSKDLGGVLMEVVRVDDVLKRWSTQDDFYTA